VLLDGDEHDPVIQARVAPLFVAMHAPSPAILNP
jgi:hypothetical protein